MLAACYNGVVLNGNSRLNDDAILTKCKGSLDMDEPTRDQLKKSYYVTLSLGLIMAIPILIYPMLGNSILQNISIRTISPTASLNVLRIILIAISFLGIILIKPICHKIMSAEKNLSSKLPTDIIRKRIITSLSAPHIISSGFSIVIAFFGFILFILSADLKNIYIFSALALISIIVSIPRLRSWERKFDVLEKGLEIKKSLTETPENEYLFSPEHPTVYPVSLGWKIFFSVLLAPIAVLCGWLALRQFYIHDWKNNLSIICFLLKSIATVFFWHTLIAAYKLRFEIYTDRIVNVGFFKTGELFFKEIDGFRILRGRNSNAIAFYPKNSDKNKIKTDLIFKNSDLLLKWANEKFINIDEDNYKKEMEIILHNNAIGTTEKQRAEGLDRAKKWVRIFNGISYTTTFWGIILPRPYNMVIWMLFLLPVISVIYLSVFAGLVKFSSWRKSAYPLVGGGFMTASLALCVRAAMDWNILNWQSFWIPFALFFFCAFFAIMFFSPDNRRDIRSIAVICLCCSLFGFGSTISLNGILDSSSPTTFRTEIINKRISYNKGPHYYLKLSSGGPWTKEREVRVSEPKYKKHNIKDSINVNVFTGAFMISYFDVN